MSTGFDWSMRPKSCPWFDCKVTLETLSGFQYRDAFPSIVEEQVESACPICPDERIISKALSVTCSFCANEGRIKKVIPTIIHMMRITERILFLVSI